MNLQKKLFFVSFLLFLLPPFYFLTPRLNIHTLAKILVLVLTVWTLFTQHVPKPSRLFYLAFLFFFSQCLSIFGSLDILSFLSRYEDLFFSFLFLGLLGVFLNKQNHRVILVVLIVTTTINTFIKLFIFLFPEATRGMFSIFLSEQYVNLILFNIERHRIYLDVFDEAVVPILIYFLFQEKSTRNRVAYGVLLTAISALSYLSNIRTNFIMLLLAVFPTLIFLKQKKVLRSLAFISICLTFVALFNFQSYSTNPLSVLDRLMLSDKLEDQVTLTSRLDHWKRSVDIGVSNPLFGVGLGNYYLYLDGRESRSLYGSAQEKEEHQLAVSHPHNILFATLAETGIVGLLSLMTLLLYFTVADIQGLFRRSENYMKALIISFWVLFFYALFNPPIIMKYQVLFWTFRMLIEVNRHESKSLNVGNDKIIEDKVLS